MTDCIEHTQKGDRDGYGHTARVIDGARRQCKLHRIVYCEAQGIPLAAIDGKVVRHSCDNPRCINPEHLLIGTHLDNMRDKSERGRSASGSASPVAKLTTEQVLAIRAEYVPFCSVNGGAALAEKFGCHRSTIYRVLGEHTWAPDRMN